MAQMQSLSSTAVCYQWQLFDGEQWLQIAHDDIIETHYCQPGAKGMTLNTKIGHVYINFDEMTAEGPDDDLRVQRQLFLSHNQRQEMGWYYKDNRYWCEYGTQGSGGSRSSVSSQNLEQQFNLNPVGSFNFTVGNNTYTLDFRAMTQTNLSTNVSRRVRRRPKFNSIITNSSLPAISQPPTIQPSLPPPTGYTWEFMGDEGIWTEYQRARSSLSSADIERLYQQNPQGQISFTAGKFKYTLYFSEMCQINDRIGTRRAIRRIIGGNPQGSSIHPQVQWQFKDMDGSWKDYIKGTARGSCSVSAQDIETQYQQNPNRTMQFSAGRFSYELDFSAMTQKNLLTLTTRPVRRI
ncbi:zinc finger CCCH-type antiviral protein 1 [Chanos chanos]|uniref:Zinc finger CCCH-type antiviral protein 1 n=1 Tax=Chanos chanos TaxID=29144 RepID=A0A6J2V9F1_CHACN|nr:zinc finger CCCH-type antiviral protein 1-like [Chanos chanos]